MNAVYGSILENLKLVEIIYEETIEVFKKDRTNTADSKEVTVSEFVKSYLPHEYQVKEQTKIYGKKQETNNIDCVILAPNHPRLITPAREIVLAEGVYAAIEVKPDISTLTEKSEFFRGLQQIKSVKNIERKVHRIDLSKLDGSKAIPKYFDKIPTIMFASKSSDVYKTISFMAKCVRDGHFNKYELPDAIISLEKGVIMYNPHWDATNFSKGFVDKRIKIPDSGFLSYESTDKANNLVHFLRILLNVPSPDIKISNFILNPYLNEIEDESKMSFSGLP